MVQFIASNRPWAIAGDQIAYTGYALVQPLSAILADKVLQKE